MYKKIIRPLLFRVGPETIHHLVSLGLSITFAIPGVKWVAKTLFIVKNPKLEKRVFGLNFSNPVGMAAGFDKEAKLYNHLNCFGFSHVEIGTVTPQPQKGNPKPRLFRLPKDKALVNRMGFNNPGVKEVIKNLRRKKPQIIIGCNIGKNTSTPNEQAIGDYCTVFDAVHHYVDYFVVNISCPNIKDLNKLQDKENTTKILEALTEINSQKPQKKPILLKISPDLTEYQIDETLEVIRQTGINGVVATNTTTTRDNLTSNTKKINSAGTGGLSGLPLQKKATETIEYISRKTGGKLPIIGVGGVFSPGDAKEKLEAGASLIQVYTGFIYEGPFVAKKINKLLLNNNLKG